MIGEIKLNYKKILYASITFILITLGVLMGIKVAIFFLPFLIAFIIAKVMRKPVEFLHKRFKVSKILGVIATMLVFLIVVGAILYFFCTALFREIITLSEQTQYIFPPLYNNISTQIGRFNFFFNNLNISPELVTGIQNSLLGVINGLLTTITNWINKAGNFAIDTIMNFPTILIYIIITILATFFMSSDYKYISDSLEKYLPLKWIKKAEDIIDGLFHSLGAYLKAIGILISITFCELLIGFTLFEVDYAVILAVVIAIIDALPILGTGTVLIPWGIVSLIMGDITFGFCILGLYLFILIVRQLIEPKIVGQQIGVYPLLTLIAMYTGVKFVGLGGVILGPIVLIILKNVFSSVYEKGVLKELFGN